MLKVLIDGIDLTGKTTTARALAQLVGGRHSSGPIYKGTLGRLADRVVAGRSPPIIKGAASTFAYLLDHRALSQTTQILIQDRYWPSLLAYARISYPRPIPNISAALFRRCPRFDANILLTAPFEVLVERYGSRDRRDRVEEKIARDRGFAERYQSALREIMQGLSNFREFDTSESAPHDTAREIAARLREANLLPSV